MGFYFVNEYFNLIVFGLISFGLAIAICFLSIIASSNNPTPEKLSAYECGFNPFTNARQEFTVQFYATALLFIIFDAETTLLFPLALGWPSLNMYTFILLFVFFFILLAGIVYEMYLDALLW